MRLLQDLLPLEEASTAEAVTDGCSMKQVFQIDLQEIVEILREKPLKNTGGIKF